MTGRDCARRSYRWAALAAAALLSLPFAGVTATPASATPATPGTSITSFPLSTFTRDIAPGPDGALWFTNSGSPGSSIGRITTSGVVSTFTDPTVQSPGGITAGPDGALWFTNAGPTSSSIGRITTSGVITNYTDPSISDPDQITAGPDGALWFTNFGNSNVGDTGSIGRITTAGVVTNFTDPSIDGPLAISAGADGALWFTNYAGSSIGRITTAGVVTNFTAPTIKHPAAITAGPDGALWFTNTPLPTGTSSIGRITTAGVVTNFTDPSIDFPGGIAAGADGALWFTNLRFDSIGRITTTGIVSTTRDTAIPGVSEGPFAIAAGPDGALWFTIGGTETGGSIARITTGLTPRVPRSASAAPGNGETNLQWKVPVSTGGSPIVAYAVTAYIGSAAQASTQFDAAHTAAIFTGLVSGKTYQFKIAAVSKRGIGAWTDFTAPIRVGAPAAPKAVTAKRATAGVLRVSFSAPATNGAPIISYTASCRSSTTGLSKSVAGKAGPIMVGGLKPGTVYTCTVTATNSRGKGLASLPTAPVKV